jgi:hypothetical protein
MDPKLEHINISVGDLLLAGKLSHIMALLVVLLAGLFVCVKNVQNFKGALKRFI